MTNSHNRTNSHQAESSGAGASSPASTGSSNNSSNANGRFFANNSGKYSKSSPTGGGSAKKQLNASLNSSSSSSGRGYFHNQSQQQPYSNENSHDKFFMPLKSSGIGATSTPGKSRSSPQHRSSPTGANGAAVLAQLSSSPPNLSHFAGSKCYDAPAPTALPKPPRHWTGAQDVIMALPVAAATAVLPSQVASPPKNQKSQAYYQQKHVKVGAAVAGKVNAAKKHVHQHHRQNSNHHQPMHYNVSCSREYLMAATSVGGDYDKFSENLKMVLNVRA